MSKRIAVLGAGMVGSAIAIDLCRNFAVTSFDMSQVSLDSLQTKEPAVQVFKSDLSKYESYPNLLADFDFIVCAVPGFMGFKSLEAIINCGKNVVDISFFPENALELSKLAIEKNVTAIVDCGVAPGMSNLILGYENARMKIKSFNCVVGGLPVIRTQPFQYKAPFSPVDVIEEYTRPARYVENGYIVEKPALSDAEFLQFDKIGTLESFNTDGLRSILHTMSHIPFMKEKTLRYPGHIDLMRALIDSGFLDHEKIQVKGIEVSPLEFTSALLFNQWKLEPCEKEFTVMRIIIQGSKDGVDKTVQYDLYDEYDKLSNISSMSRTTGYACAAVVNLMATGYFRQCGIFPPELIGHDQQCFNYIINYLKERNIIYLYKES